MNIKNEKKRRIGGCVMVLVLVLLGLGCSESEQVEMIDTVASQDIIGGYVAAHNALDHTGALLAKLEDGFEPFCSATLISDRAVVTAKHCSDLPYPIYFGVGVDAYNPDQIVPVAAIATSPLDDGGFTGYGQDVAIMHLDYALPDITPATPMESSNIDSDSRFVTMGYGVFSAGDAYDGQRRIGRETVAALDGLTLEAMFGDFESFAEWWITGDTTDEDILETMPEDMLEWVEEIYYSEELLPENEIVTGEAATDTQSCYGDSGGPLLQYSPNGWETYGVVSGGLNSLRSVCDYGTVYATFGPEVMDFMADALTWQDPCDAAAAHSSCSNNVATNCETDLLEGVRELVTEDCSETDEICVLVDGLATCGIIPEQSNVDAGVETEEIQEFIADRFYFSRP